MHTVTREQLDEALELWDQASERARLESNALVIVLQDQHVLIRSMIKTGQTYAQASKQVDDLATSHSDALHDCFKEVSQRCREYRELERQFQAQTLP